MLHITTPALISVETFDFIISSTVTTQSTPQWSNSTDNSTLLYMQRGGAFVEWLGCLDESKKLGLYNGSLYDVLTSPYPDSGTGNVSAVGFNITCGSAPDVVIKMVSEHTMEDRYYNISFPSDNVYNVSLLLPPVNMVSDSEGTLGSRVALSSNISLQVIQCSKSVVSQQAQVHTDSRQIIPGSLNPVMQKTYSRWQTHDKLLQTANRTTLLEGDYWAEIVTNSPLTGVIDEMSFLRWGEIYLQDKLHLTSKGVPLQLLYLHDIENALSNLVASIFWIGGHVHQTPMAMADYTEPDERENIHPPTLSTGNTTVQEVVAAARLDASIGLGASMLLLLLAITFSAGTRSSKPGLSGMGFLQIIWVFEHHPELSGILEQVEDPTDYNLRVAGLVKVRLSDAL
ncbi:hypothetical protein B0H13DRAFT_2523798 [Mycena leptocephala]|nr:hypothetical protein B0H13DRAFT_2523798 [Mycena leptocephala]